MSVPEDVLGLLADLREMLQDKMEPPVYVSDRRLVKAIALLKVRSWGCLYLCTSLGRGRCQDTPCGAAAASSMSKGNCTKLTPNLSSSTAQEPRQLVAQSAKWTSIAVCHIITELP